LSIITGIAGKFLSERVPWPWTGAEKVVGKPVGFANVLVAATMEVATKAMLDAVVIELDLAGLKVAAAVESLMETNGALIKRPTLTAPTITEPASTPTRSVETSAKSLMLWWLAVRRCRCKMTRCSDSERIDAERVVARIRRLRTPRTIFSLAGLSRPWYTFFHVNALFCR
jgi:hypothetical protein